MKTSSADVVRLEKDESPRQQPVKVSVTLNEVKVTLEEVKVINSSCVQLYWQLIGQLSAVQLLRVQYWVVSSSDSELAPSSAIVPLSTEFILDGLEEDTRYGLCVQPVYKSGVVGECSNTRHAYVTQQYNGKHLLHTHTHTRTHRLTHRILNTIHTTFILSIVVDYH